MRPLIIHMLVKSESWQKYMKRNNSWGTLRATRVQEGAVVRLSMASIAIVIITLAWTLQLSSHGVAQAFSAFKEYPTQPADPWGITMDYTRGDVWVAEPNCDASPTCSKPAPGLIGRYTMANPASNQKNYTPPATYNPVFLALNNKGRLWFTDPSHNAIGELIPSTNKWQEFVVPTANAAPYDLVIDKNGNIWFTEILASNIGYYNPNTHVFVETHVPTTNSGPYGIIQDGSGNIWFTENAVSKIASFKPTKSGTGITITEIATETGSNTPTPHLLTTDKSGNIWYSEGFAGQVGVYNVSTKTHKDYLVSVGISQTHISGIGVDSNGLVWFNDSLSARIGTLDPATSKVTAIQLSFTGAHPHDGLTIDKTNTVWITEQYGFRLGEVLP